MFGMGTGGSLRLLSPEILCGCLLAQAPFRSPSLAFFHTLKTAQEVDHEIQLQSIELFFRSSPRPISIAKLHTLLRFHRRPIYLIVSEGSYSLLAMAILFSRGASRLDAFSVYPVRTSLPSCAFGKTTVAPEVRPSRSSRTRDSSCHDSCAHDG